MIGDHHGQMAGSATLLVRAMHGILGTHSPKVLRLDDGLYVAIVQWDAGFELPALDEHGGEEIVYVLEGTFVNQHRSSGPGTVIRREAGSTHRPGTPTALPSWSCARWPLANVIV